MKIGSTQRVQQETSKSSKKKQKTKKEKKTTVIIPKSNSNNSKNMNFHLLRINRVSSTAIFYYTLTMLIRFIEYTLSQ